MSSTPLFQISTSGVIFDDSGRLNLQRVDRALQRLCDDPLRLSLERHRRFNEPAPPYPDSLTEDCTLPPSPGTPGVDNFHLEQRRKEAHHKSKPLNQFKCQLKRYEARMLHQNAQKPFGRKETLRFHDHLSTEANAENYVRSLWIDQGIWESDWDRAWLENSKTLSKWGDNAGQFQWTHSNFETLPGALWAHERPYAEAEPHPDPKVALQRQTRPFQGPVEPFPSRGEQLTPYRGHRTCISSPTGPTLLEMPIVTNLEPSRPYPQFLYQISKEREWIKDEMGFNAPDISIDLDAMAYQSVRENWVEDGVWHPKWGEIPGSSWLHEEPGAREVLAAPATPDNSLENLTDTVEDTQEGHSTQFPASPAPALHSGALSGRIDGASSRFFEGIKAFKAGERLCDVVRDVTKRQFALDHAKKTLNYSPLMEESPSPRETQQGTHAFYGITRCLAEKKRPVKHSRLFQQRHMELNPQGFGEGVHSADFQNTMNWQDSGPSGTLFGTFKAKRHRDCDTTEDEQPSKRMKLEDPRSIASASSTQDAADLVRGEVIPETASQTVQSDYGGKTLRYDKMAPQRKGRKRTGTITEALRRSARLAPRK